MRIDGGDRVSEALVIALSHVRGVLPVSVHLRFIAMGYWGNMMLHRPIDCVGDATVVSDLPLGPPCVFCWVNRVAFRNKVAAVQATARW
jgi:hypothetical protein